MSPASVYRLSRPGAYICQRCLLRPKAPIAARARRALHVSSTTTATRQTQDTNILHLLQSRGYINQIAGDETLLSSLLRKKRLRFYAGVDPTAPSLHLGHLLPVMVLFWLTLHGQDAVSLVGGGTARVGDPSGRLLSRAKTMESVQRSNAESMFAQTKTLWENALQCARGHGFQDERMGKHFVLDNGQWLDRLNVLDFLKTLGNGMRLGAMLGRDTVRNKMEMGDGMSFSEFTYPLLQAWDWWHMYATMDVQVQIGGSDQYGNIVAGMDAVRYIAQTQEDDNDIRTRCLDEQGRLRRGVAPMGLTVPLLTTSSGEKFGKSAGNAIWLDAKMTSPFDLYGFLLRSSDADVERYLKLFTFVSSDAIQDVMTEHSNDPGKRIAQHLLATQVLELVHGREEALSTRQRHESARRPVLSSSSTTSEAAQATTDSLDSDHIRLPASQVLNTPFARILFHAGLVASKSEGARLVAKGGLYVASLPPSAGPTSGEVEPGRELIWTQVKDQKPEDVQGLLLDGKLLMLRIGKWKGRTVEVVDNGEMPAAAAESDGRIK